MSRKSTLGDALAAHPSVDMLAPAIPIIIWAISGRPARTTTSRRTSSWRYPPSLVSSWRQ